MSLPATKPDPLPVLLIEDEPAVMAYVRAVLERSGYAVVCTASGVDALHLLESSEFLGVISDMRTPGGVDGGDVYAWIAQNRPALAPRVVFITGDIANEETVATLQQNRRALRGEAIPRETVHRGGRENHRKGDMSEDLRIRLLIVDDEAEYPQTLHDRGRGAGLRLPGSRRRRVGAGFARGTAGAHDPDRHGDAQHVRSGVPGESQEAAAAHRSRGDDRATARLRLRCRP